MAATTITVGSAGVSAQVRQAYDLSLLNAAYPELVHAQFAEKRPIPTGQGKVINLRRLELLSAATTALTEGVTPVGSTSNWTNIAIQCAQYGDFEQFSDMFEWTSIDPVVDDIVKNQGQQAGNTLDQISRDVYATGSNVRYAAGRAGRSSVAAGDIMNGTEIKKAVRSLKNSNAKRVNGYYNAIISPSVEYDIMGATEWLAVKEYSDRMDLYNGEVGMLYGVRFSVTTNAKVFPGAGSANADVHGSLFFGAQAFGASEISGHAMQTIIKPIGTVGGDNLDQRGSVGWKVTFGTSVLNDQFVVRVESGVTG